MTPNEQQQKRRQAKCRKCGEALHELIDIQTSSKIGARQCINHNCKRYGIRT